MSRIDTHIGRSRGHPFRSLRTHASAGLPGAGPSVLTRTAASLAHNVNNSLTAVIMSLELVQREVLPGSEGHDRISEAISCALALAGKVRRLVAFTTQTEGVEKKCVVPLNRIVADVARQVPVLSPQMKVVCVNAPSECAILANETLLDLVLEQVVSNALEAMPQGGTLSLGTRADGHRCCIWVSDTGEGLSPEVRNRLFEPYFTTKAFGHLGVGLALCRELLEMQGGTIHLSTAEGKGTTVTLSFPPAGQAS